jgi:dolichol-phosphate mannosyltransferase
MQLSVIIPCYNEHDNVRPLFAKLVAALEGIEWEAVYVDDDSPDGTSQEVLALAKEDGRARLVRRVGRRGLSSACIEGMLASSSPVFAVIDGDMQHDETVLPQMLKKIEDDGCDIVVGSRYTEGGSTGDWNAARLGMSKFATILGNVLLKENSTTDPMSGFFMLKRDLLDEVVHGLSGEGFKILLDVLATSNKNLNVGEVAYTFRTREFGESKLDARVLSDFALLLFDKLIGKIIPARFLMFVTVGLIGVGVHLGILGLFNQILDLKFWGAQLAATVVAMTSNFFINNVFTYGDRRLKKNKLVWGLVKFFIICGIGAIPNVLFANYLFEDRGVYWLLSGIAGMIVSSIWNYSVSRYFIWRAN